MPALGVVLGLLFQVLRAIGGRRSKLWGGGGELVAHSSVFPSHGSSPAGSPLMNVAITLIRNGMMLTATMKAPTVEMVFRTVQPASGL